MPPSRDARRRVLTKTEERIIRYHLARGATDREAQAAAQVSARKFYLARLYDLRDLPRQSRGPRPDRDYEPPPDLEEISVEEIYRRAAAIRQTWDEETRRERWNPRFSPGLDE